MSLGGRICFRNSFKQASNLTLFTINALNRDKSGKKPAGGQRVEIGCSPDRTRIEHSDVLFQRVIRKFEQLKGNALSKG